MSGPATGRPTDRAGRGPAPILLLHGALVVVLAIVTILFFAVPTSAADCCIPVAIFGVVTLGELLAVLVGLAIAGTTGRHSPLAVFDAITTAPFALFVLSGSPDLGGPTAGIVLVAPVLLLVGTAAAILAARVVREHDLERYVLAGALVLVTAFSSAIPIATIVPVAVLVALLWPHRAAAELDMIEPSAGPGSADPGAVARVPARPGPSRPVRPLVRRSRAPDAAAVLAARRPAPSPLGEEPGTDRPGGP